MPLLKIRAEIAAFFNPCSHEDLREEGERKQISKKEKALEERESNEKKERKKVTRGGRFM